MASLIQVVDKKKLFQPAITDNGLCSQEDPLQVHQCGYNGSTQAYLYNRPIIMEYASNTKC